MILGGLEAMVVIGVARYVYKSYFNGSGSSMGYLPPLSIVSLVGAASSGKSSLGNRLLGSGVLFGRARARDHRRQSRM